MMVDFADRRLTSWLPGDESLYGSCTHWESQHLSIYPRGYQ
ncbi:MAG: hypothetical protein VKL39_15900 [Leptolyngbyaceae bacterium]|nr:hypothetical protein [Leptolyngbyaceae bacterium]